ncbi:MAG: hypothetical protein EZS28_033413, partial [Streblomastix strix]
WKELDTDLTLDAVKLQSSVSDSEEQSLEKDQSTAFWNNPRKRFRQDDRSSLGGNNQNFQPRYNNGDDFRSQGRGQSGGRGDVTPWPPVESVPATASNTVVPDPTQRQVGGPTPQLVRTPDSWKSNKTSTPKYQSKQPTPTQATTEQDHLLHPPVAVFLPPINPSNIVLPPVAGALPNNITQPVNNIIPDPPNSWSSRATQPLSLKLRAELGAKRLHDQRILQESKARNEYRINMRQSAQNKAQKYLMDGILMNLEARSKGLDNSSYNPFENFQPNFDPNQYIDDLSQIPSKDQQKYFNDFDQYQIQRDDDHDSNDDIFGESDLIELQVRGRRGRGKKNRGRGKAQSQEQPLLSSHQPIQGSTQSKIKVPGQRHGKTGAANGTINPSAQSSHIKQIAGWSDFNFGSAPPQLGTASWHAGGENANVFAALRANIEHQNNGNEMNIPQQAHLAAQGAGGPEFQPLMGPEQVQSEDEPEQDQGQQDLNNLPDIPGNEGPPGLTQETRRSQANQGSTKSRSKSSRKKKKGR